MLTYGAYGGRFVPETVIPALDELEHGWGEARADDAFNAELHALLSSFGGRPTPLTLATRFAPGKRCGGKSRLSDCGRGATLCASGHGLAAEFRLAAPCVRLLQRSMILFIRPQCGVHFAFRCCSGR